MLNFIQNLMHYATLNIAFSILFRVLILLCVLQLVHVVLAFLSKQAIANIDDKEQVKQVRTMFLTLKSVLDIVISILFIMEILPKLGIDIRPILTAAGVLGVAVGFGAKRIVEDILTGATIILEGEIRVGDIIETAGKFGTVEKLNLKKVTLRDLDGKVHYIRNGMIDIVTNYTRNYAYAIINIGIAYKENIDNVINIVKDIADNELKNSSAGQYLSGNLEVLGVDELAESSVNLKFRIKTVPTHQWEVTREFNRFIKNKFDELNIDIPFPQRTVHIENK